MRSSPTHIGLLLDHKWECPRGFSMGTTGFLPRPVSEIFYLAYLFSVSRLVYNLAFLLHTVSKLLYYLTFLFTVWHLYIQFMLYFYNLVNVSLFSGDIFRVFSCFLKWQRSIRIVWRQGTRVSENSFKLTRARRTLLLVISLCFKF